MKYTISIIIVLVIILMYFIIFNEDEVPVRVFTPVKIEDSLYVKKDSIKIEVDNSFKKIDSNIKSIKETVTIIKFKTNVEIDSIDIVNATNELRQSSGSVR